MNKKSKLNLNAIDYAVSHCDSDKTYNGLEVQKMLYDAYITGNKDNDKNEEIRKAIIHFISHTPTVPKGIIDKEQMLTWLEKQNHDGKKWIYEDVYLKEKEQLIQDGIDEVLEDPQKFGLEKQGNITKLSEEEQNKFAKGVLTSCALSFIDYLDAHKYEGKMCVSNGECEDIENAFHNAIWGKLHRYYCKYIEKQSEQNYESQSIAESRPAKLPDGIEFPFKARVKKNNKIVVITNGQLNDTQPKDSRSYIAYTSDITDGYKVYKPEELEFIKQPGFKIGDWVVNKLGKAWHIDSSYGKNYQVSDGKGNYSYFPISKQDEMHLWSIEDAKGGDVLVDKSDGTIGIFQSIGHHPDGGSFNDPSYCYLHCRYDDEFFYADFENGNTMDSNDAIPATKQQCDLLFQKMKEAGYSWDGKLKKSTKFSKGDWIYRGTGDPYLVESVFKEQYELCSGFGYHFNKGIDEVDSDYRLWNINDAKFGDILADDNTIAIYEEQSTKTFFHVLCYYCKKTFVPKKGTLAVLGFHPVTKEQRELFSNELKKSGYNLDLEKKQLTDQPELTKFEQSLKHIIEEALDDGDTHNLKADAELLLSVANQDRVKIELTKEEEDALEQAIISLEDMFDSDQPETCYAGHHVPFDVAAKCLSNLKDKILNSK